jgi:hypothetical protein
VADLRDVLNTRLDAGYQVIDYTISDLSPEQLHHVTPGATIGTPASIYLHAAWVQDLIVNQMLRGEASVYDAEGWSDKLPGAPVHRGPSTLEWAHAVRIDDVAAVKAYADSVRTKTREYIASLSGDELDREVPFFAGPESQANILSYLIWDLANHTGEIAAMRGLAGKKGLPF